MKELIEKHKEAIEESHRLAFQLGQQWVQDITNDRNPISFTEWWQLNAESCALITQRHGEIQRLEGMIEAYKNCDQALWIDYEIKDLEKQLKALKG